MQTADVWSKPGQQSAFANVSLTAGRHTFVSLLVPVRISDLPAHALRSFETDLVQTAGGGVVATVSWWHSMCVTTSPYCGTAVEISLNDDENGSSSGDPSWHIKRTPLA